MQTLEKPAIYTLAKVSEHVGISVPTARDWLRRGIIRASVRNAGKAGTELLFSYGDLFVARCVSAVRCGHSLRLDDESTRRVCNLLYDSRWQTDELMIVVMLNADGNVFDVRFASTNDVDAVMQDAHRVYFLDPRKLWNDFVRETSDETGN